MPAAAMRIRVPAQAEQMARVRAEVGEYARDSGMTEIGVENAQTIVTEACANSIKHAYGDSPPGSLEISADTQGEQLLLVVRDFGSGIGPRTDAAHSSLHAGLSIIGALSSSFRLSSHRGQGTEIEVRLPIAEAA